MYLKALDGIIAAFLRREATVTTLPLAYSKALKIERELNQQGVGEMNVTTMQSIHPFNAYTQNLSFQSAPNLSTFPLQPQALAIDASVAIGPIVPQTSSFLNNPFMNPNSVLINPQTNKASFRPSFLNPIPQVANTNVDITNPSGPPTGFMEI